MSHATLMSFRLPLVVCLAGRLGRSSRFARLGRLVERAAGLTAVVFLLGASSPVEAVTFDDASVSHREIRARIGNGGSTLDLDPDPAVTKNGIGPFDPIPAYATASAGGGALTARVHLTSEIVQGSSFDFFADLDAEVSGVTAGPGDCFQATSEFLAHRVEFSLDEVMIAHWVGSYYSNAEGAATAGCQLPTGTYFVYQVELLDGANQPIRLLADSSVGTHENGEIFAEQELLGPGDYSIEVNTGIAARTSTNGVPISLEAQGHALGTLTFRHSCAGVNECSFNGACTAFDTCTCDPGTSGADCSTIVQVPVLSPWRAPVLALLLVLIAVPPLRRWEDHR